MLPPVPPPTHRCVELLQAALVSSNQDHLHGKLADVLSAMGQHSEALAYYHTALSLNPSSEVRGLCRLIRRAPSDKTVLYLLPFLRWPRRVCCGWRS